MSEIRVKFEDRDPDVHKFHTALKIAGISASYEYADLIQELYKKATETEEGGTLKDITQAQLAWEKKWEKYFKDQEKDGSTN